jgi:hypothetical protein
VEQRRSNLTNTKVQKIKPNEYYQVLSTNDDDEIIDINMSVSQQQMNQGNKNQYYQDRASAVQSIEKTMNDLASMFSRLSHIVYEQRSMIYT